MNKADIEEWRQSLRFTAKDANELCDLCDLALRGLEAGEPTNREKIYGPLLDKIAGNADVWLAVESHDLKLAALRTRAEEAERKLAQARTKGMEEAAKICEEDESGRDSGGYFADAIRAKMEGVK